jgi:hypothetical protein
MLLLIIRFRKFVNSTALFEGIAYYNGLWNTTSHDMMKKWKLEEVGTDCFLSRRRIHRLDLFLTPRLDVDIGVENSELELHPSNTSVWMYRVLVLEFIFN